MRAFTMESRTENMKPSGLRPPSQYSSVQTLPPMGLHEMTESEGNARARTMPAAQGMKRAYAGPTTQPEPKRKTLVERAGEPLAANKPSIPTVTASSLVRPTVKGTSIASLTANNLKAHTATASRGPTLPGPASIVSSFSRTVGPGSRPPTSARPGTSLGNNFGQSTYGRQRAGARSRPATAMGDHGFEDDVGQGQQQPNGWDVDERLDGIENQFKAMKEAMTTSLTDRKTLEDAVDMAKTQLSTLERDKQRLEDRNFQLQDELAGLQRQVVQLTLDLEGEQRKHKYNVEDMSREHRQALDELRRELKDETDRMQRTHREELEALERHYRVEMEDERSQKSKELQELRARLGAEQQDLSLAILGKEREIQDMRSQLEVVKSDLDREQTIKGGLQKQVAEMSTTAMTLEDRNRALRAQIDFLESDSKQQSDSFAAMEARLQDALRIADEARQKLIKEETERRILFNKYQELKGNIRVMCRVRPVLNESEGNQALIAYPDLKTSAQIDVTGPEERSSLGNTIRKVIPFEFDRVFTPAIHNEEIFGEISQLVQSALDGFNVCIFCYGQTGSGKTYTMSSPDGMIPRATHMIYETVTKLKEKSWTYTMEGSFVEVYNEELHDLLTPNTEQKKKLEIRHDDARKQTTVLNCKTVALDSPNTVELMLQQAQNNRSVAATKANERSSRSHSVFILKLVGENSATNERCEGTLNLVDLAGSERLKHSQAEGDRMKETQNINKSLACLGDVIEALGRGSGHIPYRNSKLTHLLQYSLGGNSKTLMFVMVSPLEAHLKETITSLRFATKVHNTHIGTAKSTKKTKERISDC
ncbi:P-loop containing nucleoside triphosphate hydrolase protein [Podospora aff. communis PSN243]|uniref:Kinesin-like protein n=1 Tax=Podospora aff. communis PSN243 TaxID=3040156 RepID=A0AAV9GJU4_9PEZI|nr:P-loop containing nucleoside triphosphate hydrolase protein [Podospora aff. communis PSN243]